MRRIIFITMVALLLISITGCKMPQNQLVVVEENNEVNITEGMEKVIAEYIEGQVVHKSRGGTSFSAQEIYGTELKNDGEIYVYLWTYYQEYHLKNGELEQGGGASMPLVILLEKEGDENYFVTKHYSPGLGSEYAPSIRQLFPEKYHDRIFSRNNVHDLEPLVRQKAEAYFNQISSIFKQDNFIFRGKERRIGVSNLNPSQDQTTFVVNNRSIYMWRFFGPVDSFGDEIKITATSMDRNETIDILTTRRDSFETPLINFSIPVGEGRSDTGVQIQENITSQSIPFEGLWRLDVYFDDEYFDNVVIQFVGEKQEKRQLD